MTDQAHRYRVGQIVEILPSTLRSAAHGQYEIVQLVPCDANDPQYRIKSRNEKHVRVVSERDLVAVANVLSTVK
ncbi:MAG: hypothetical protein HY659_09695 [Rhizobiales bacterium]|nr:hypothetical protein [Hyphomicrobiales bacterium]